MLLLDSLAEEQILAAIRRGEFDDLAGEGRPLTLDDEGAVPDELRVGFRLLKNAGCLPPELMLRRDITEVEALLRQAETVAEAQSLRQKLHLLKTRLALQGRETSLLLEEATYRQKLLCRLARAASRIEATDNHG